MAIVACKIGVQFLRINFINLYNKWVNAYERNNFMMLSPKLQRYGPFTPFTSNLSTQTMQHCSHAESHIEPFFSAKPPTFLSNLLVS
jgi:hypothetical protein